MTCEHCLHTMRSAQTLRLEDGPDQLRIIQWHCPPCKTTIEEINVIPASSYSLPRKIIYPVRSIPLPIPIG